MDYLQAVDYSKKKAAADRVAAAEKEAAERARLYGNVQGQAGAASKFAGQGEQGFGQLGTESAALRGQLGDIASGKLSQSKEVLRQGLQQNLAAQQSMAASARPQNAAMAARTAMMGAGRLGAGLSGQQALASIAERQGAMQSLGNMLGQQRGLELQAALGSRGQALQGYGAILDDETRRKLGIKDEGSTLGGAIGAVGGALVGGLAGGPAGAATGSAVGGQLGQRF